MRRDAVGDDVTYVVNRNINFTNVCYTGCRFCAFAQRRTDADAYTLSLSQVGDRADEAWEVGATEVCMQGGIHPDLPGHGVLRPGAAEVKRRAPGHPSARVLADGGRQRRRPDRPVHPRVADRGASEAGVDSLPGTAAEILDDDVRWVLTKGKLPRRPGSRSSRTAHELGHPDDLHDDVRPCRHPGPLGRPTCGAAPGSRSATGGFTEFVPLPFVHTNAPIYLAGLARPGPTRAGNRAVHAVARLLLHGAIDNIQCSWVKLGAERCRQVLPAASTTLAAR